MLQRRRREIIEPTLKASECEPRRVGSSRKENKPRRGGTIAFLSNNLSTQRRRAQLQSCVNGAGNKTRPRKPGSPSRAVFA